MAELFPGNQVLDDQLNTPWLTMPKFLGSTGSPIDLVNSVNSLYSSAPAGTTIPLQPNSGTTGPGAEGHKNIGSNDDISTLGGRKNNPLGDYSSYTYHIALRMVTPTQYNRYIDGDDSAVKEMTLIVESGGKGGHTKGNFTSGIAASTAVSAMPLDYYIDNLRIETHTAAGETGIPSNSLNFTFQIFEPYGCTFITSLVKQANVIAASSSEASVVKSKNDSSNALQQAYLLTISFYGYDAAGNLIQGKNTNISPNSIFERSFPILLNKFTFRLDNKMVIYNATGKLLPMEASSSQRGVLSSSITLKASTVEEALVGSTNKTGNKTIIGLCQAVNEAQQKLVAENKIERADKISVEFTDDTIARASIGAYYKPATPMTQVSGTAQSNVKTSESNRGGVIDTSMRGLTIPTGQSFLQTIEQVISSSSYITNKLTSIDLEETQHDNQCGPDYIEEQGNKLAWFNITPRIEMLGWDNKRHTHAYHMTYVINRYEIPYIRSLYVKNSSPYYGPHKIYEYWYTGKNKEIISYEQDYNTLYYVMGALSSDAPATGNSQGAPIAFKAGGTNAENTTRVSGTDGQIASVKSFLYSPADAAGARIKILGDPDYLMTAIDGQIVASINKAYGKDLTINPNSGQVFIEIGFKQVDDYNPSDGLLTTNNSILFWDYPKAIAAKTEGRMIFQVIKVTSEFNRGIFTQELKTMIPPFYNDDIPAEPTAKPTAQPTVVAPNVRKIVDYGENEDARLLNRANDAVSKITSAASPTIARSIATNTGNTVVDDNGSGPTKNVADTAMGREIQARITPIASNKNFIQNTGVFPTFR